MHAVESLLVQADRLMFAMHLVHGAHPELFNDQVKEHCMYVCFIAMSYKHPFIHMYMYVSLLYVHAYIRSYVYVVHSFITTPLCIRMYVYIHARMYILA